MSSNAANSSVPTWQAFVRMQAILAYPRHPHWDTQARAEYAYCVSWGIRDVFTLSEQERERAEIMRDKSTEIKTQTGVSSKFEGV